ncbi:MAG: nitrate/sulfonate/bicarbonate ABC transporter ATP-binding protein [Candidatus Eremiobacteraeota bacterium]|nr:nitrate/sulfonate/bicarbonate ABC transporter ATP-binding protein [Candidatus Eremiobacteraeota bacterium]MBV8366132.1 nitrate/sulfonate/bicarbonate ABC transporter ATP-binding protein [Candidatus Eremiobacteraeota bacterium]
MSEALIQCRDVIKRFPLPDGKGEFTAIQDITLEVRRGEVLALLGRSGSGKSTLLRIMAGLIPPSGGRVMNGGAELRGPNSDVAMVFQSFALLPWLTVLGNVEIGLEARGVGRVERMRRAIKMIDLVGLDGFEDAYPKELSGGMKQRVGCARALVMQPKVLFMDEPFSALDVLTAENLRGEIDDLWNAGSFPSQAILIVTHNIEEAVILADRVIVFGANPGHIRGEVAIELPRPHARTDPRFEQYIDHLYAVMTKPTMAVEVDLGAGTTAAMQRSPFAQPLPHVRIGGISGLLELLSERPQNGEEIAELAERLAVTPDDLLALLDACTLLDFVRIDLATVSLTDIGRDFATTTILRSKDLFRQQLLERVPLFDSIARTLRERKNNTMRADFFLDLWDEYFPADDAQRQFATAIEWGRYAELFEYDAGEGVLFLPEEVEQRMPFPT